ncbi:hypothetical protein FBQ87_00715 [Sphingobacteriales bacterium CHB3]|nr:hypothetical protein [Sphingobacteriales bacterium CHB3]
MTTHERTYRSKYLEVLKRMTPEQRLLKAFELTEYSRQLFEQGLRRRFPDATEEELRLIRLERYKRWHSRNSY